MKSAPSEVEQYATTSSRLTGAVVILVGLVALVDIAVEWRTWGGLTVAAVVLVLMVLAYVGLMRPSVRLSPAGLRVRNHLRDHEVSWDQVEEVDVTDLVRVHTPDRRLRCSGVQLVMRDLRKQRLGRRPEDSLSQADFVVQRIRWHAEHYGRGAEDGVVTRWALPELVLLGVLLLVAAVAWLAR